MSETITFKLGTVMTDVLNGPTVGEFMAVVGEFMAVLEKYGPDTPLRMVDTDTYWTIHKIHISLEQGVLWLSGDYSEMSSRGEFNEKPEDDRL